MVVPGIFTGVLHFGRNTNRYYYFEFDYATNLIIVQLGFPLVLLFIMWSSGDGLKSFGLVRWKWWPHLPTLILVFGTMWLSLLGLDYVYHYRAFSFPPVFNLLPLRYFLVFVYYLVVGFREELYFRSYLITRLTELTNRRYVAVILSVLIFASIHLYQGWVGVGMAALFGIVASLGFIWSGSVWPLMIAHGLYDFAIFYRTYH